MSSNEAVRHWLLLGVHRIVPQYVDHLWTHMELSSKKCQPSGALFTSAFRWSSRITSAIVRTRTSVASTGLSGSSRSPERIEKEILSHPV